MNILQVILQKIGIICVQIGKAFVSLFVLGIFIFIIMVISGIDFLS